MGEVIFMVPENIRKIFYLDSIKMLEPLVKNMENNQTKNPFSLLSKYKNILGNEKISQEELHLQEKSR
jgi:hypothetical protein